MKKLLLLASLICWSFTARAQDRFIGEIKMFAGTFAPSGFAFCNGQLLSIMEYQVLFAVIGNTYGGDGKTNFA